jgi:hypothetical protein
MFMLNFQECKQFFRASAEHQQEPRLNLQQHLAPHCGPHTVFQRNASHGRR